MRVHSRQIISHIKELRKQGKSVPEIMSLTGLPKTTIWHHVHDIKLPPNLQKRISSNQGGSRKRYIEALDRAGREARRLLSSKHRELCVSSAMLYWAEGSKRELVFTNTDTAMVQVYMRFIRDVLKVPESDITPLIRISDPLKPRLVKSHWSKALNVSCRVITINHNNVQNKTKSKYGICRINVKRNSFYLKMIQCMIQDIKQTV